MKIKRKELLDILLAVRPGLADKSIVEQATHFIFTGREVLTYNDRICVSHPFESTFQCSVEADKFYKVLSKLDQDELHCDYKEPNLLISAEGVDAGLSGYAGREIFDLAQDIGLDDLEWRGLPSDFVEGVLFCGFAASRDATQTLLSCISVRDDCVVSSDNRRISEYKMQEAIETPFLIPARNAAELSKFEVIEYSVSNSWVCFRTEKGVFFCSRVVKGEYYDVTEDFVFDRTRMKLPKALKDVVDRAAILAAGEVDIDKRIDVRIGGGKISCRGEQETGWIETELDIKFKRDLVIRFSINPIFFSQILDKTSVMECGENRVLFWSGSFRHLVLLYMEDK